MLKPFVSFWGVKLSTFTQIAELLDTTGIEIVGFITKLQFVDVAFIDAFSMNHQLHLVPVRRFLRNTHVTAVSQNRW